MKVKLATHKNLTTEENKNLAKNFLIHPVETQRERRYKICAPNAPTKTIRANLSVIGIRLTKLQV